MVELRIPDDQWYPNEVNSGMDVLRRLRGLGVPVIGHLWPHGVERGTLTTTTDMVFGEHVFTWRDE